LTKSKKSPSLKAKVDRHELMAAKGYWNLGFFAKTFLPEIFRYPFSSMHLDFFEFLQDGETRQGEKMVIAAPRGHAKTTIMLLLQVIYAVCYETEKFIVIVGYNEAESQEKVSLILDTLTHNPLLKGAFGELAPKKGKGSKAGFVTRNDIKVKAVSKGQNIRGQQYNGHRPTLVILDDVESLEEVQNPEVREKTWNWVNRDILAVGEVDGTTNFMVIGTNLHDDGLLSRLKNQPGWNSFLYQAIQNNAINQGLWDEWLAIYTNLENVNNERHALDFYKRNEAAMLEGTQVLWPEVESYYDLMTLKATWGTVQFNAEKQNEPFDRDSCIFDMESASYFDWNPTDQTLLIRNKNKFVYYSQLHTIYAYLDPCVGESVQGDNAGIVVVGKDGDGYLYVLDAFVKRVPVEQQMTQCQLLYKKWGYTKLIIEGNNFQHLLYNQLKSQLETSQGGPKVEKDVSSGNKEMRISSLQPLIANSQLIFNQDIDKELIEELKYFPTALHDDGPDALAGAVKYLYHRRNPEKPLERKRPSLVRKSRITL